MAKKYYVVWKGRETGIFTDWESCRKQVDKFNGAKYKSFKTSVEAQAAFNGKSFSAPADNNRTSGASGIRKKTSSQAVKTYTAGEIAAMLTDTKIFTDGGCEPNPGEAGSGIAVYRDNVLDQLWYGLYNPQGTNNTAELNALHQALLMAEAEIGKGRTAVIFCDSQYSIKCISQWAVNWQKNGWKKSGGEIKNLKLIQKMFALYLQLKDKVQVLHVNGHVGVEGNELADRMSILAIESKECAFNRYTEEVNIQAVLAMRNG
ncbi:ribonuclease H family protein [Psychromonas ossibalaenae]|uniref:ribonuclease H family protein n=1 Tax=Psychromonas ossibalaenae TaxID=444922 RepID=UPI000362077B|nr:ribonuclease H family protein [Psychromonas ossibalaenae]